VTGSASLIAQHQAIQILNAILRKGAIPHAFLFTGTGGVGKRSVALSFAKALNCSGEKNPSPDEPAIGDTPGAVISAGISACGVCRSCRKIESGSHPDIVSLQPQGPFIRIDQIRELCRVLGMKPYEADYRTVVISDAHCMNAEAGNALLKMLEEPPDRTILILTANGTADLLPTIVSRCRHIRFHPIPIPNLARELTKAHGIDPDSARTLAVMARGSLSRAEELSRNNWLNRRKWLLQSCDMLSPSTSDEFPSGMFAAASMLFSDKESVADALEILKTIYRDVLIYRYQPENLLNPDAERRIADAAGAMSEEDVIAAVRTIDKAQDRIRANANVRLTLEALFLTLAK
jgi:DNA polymerase III subunit delta'